ncbi:MAG TPA: nickel pincer cofactor biosynthesis protein LarB [Stellaceae bacterium]|jgi:hypothetical protein
MSGREESGGDIRLDFGRAARIGLPEAILCAGKSVPQIAEILDRAAERGAGFLLTRLAPERFGELPQRHRGRLDYDPVSRTGFFGPPAPVSGPARVGIVAAGTSDMPVGREAARTLLWHGEESLVVADVGVAGLWRLLERIDELREMPVLIVAAGMDAAMVSVLGGLVPGALVAVPTSVGYGVARGGETALHAALASCAPGIAVVNIDNGYGAACAALRILRAAGRISAAQRP